jgi:hypothetical protein
MAPSRTRNTDSDGPSTADASANEDVEMKDQGDRINGFSKFGVSARVAPFRDNVHQQHAVKRCRTSRICSIVFLRDIR